MKKLSTGISLGLVAILLFLILPVLAYTGNGDTSVYVTDTGGRYHVFSCGYLRKSRIEIALEDAVIEGYTRCTVCWPPQYTGTAKPGDPKPVSDSSDSIGATPKETIDLSWLEDWEPVTFETRQFTEETYSYSYAPKKDTSTQSDTDATNFRRQNIALFCIGTVGILLFLALTPAVKLAEGFHNDTIHPYVIGCAAPLISILGRILFKWSTIVIFVVLIISIIIISVASIISMRKYRKQQTILRWKAKEKEIIQKEQEQIREQQKRHIVTIHKLQEQQTYPSANTDCTCEAEAYSAEIRPNTNVAEQEYIRLQ